MPKSYIGEIACENCKKKFKKRILPETKRHYCSMSCKRADKNSYKSEWTPERRAQYSSMMSGENNPNYGNTWSNEQKKHLSEYKKKQYKENPDLAYSCGKSNRGVKFTEERISAMHKHRSRESYVRQHSEDTRKKIGKKSKEKWTLAYKEAHRQRMEKLGYWVPEHQRDPYKVYYKEANWIESMVDYFSDKELEMLNLHGIFSMYNPKGWVRDHIVPRKVGYEHGLPAEILRHPANLQFIPHNKNITKGFADRALTESEKDSSIQLLFKKIKNYSKEWKEQEKCIQHITGAKSF